MERNYWKPYRNEEYQEDDVWDVIKDEREIGFKIGSSMASSTPFSISRRLPSASRMIPGGVHKHESHHDHDHDDHDESKVIQHSAPVNIPDWSKICGKSPRRKNSKCNSSSYHEHDHDHDEYHDDDYDVTHDEDDDDDCEDDDDDDGDGRLLPPHEWLANKLARSQISSFSVCEGVGRTLKGRDLSRVRNAVLSKTGFI